MVGLIDKRLVLFWNVTEEIVWVLGWVIVIVAGISEVIRVDVLVALALSEIEWEISVDSVAAALLIAASFTVTIPDLVAWAVEVTFVTIAIVCRTSVIFCGETVVVDRSGTRVIGMTSVTFVVIIWVINVAAVLLEKKFVVSGENAVLPAAIECVIEVDVLISRISVLVVDVEDALCWAVLTAVWAIVFISRLGAVVRGILPVSIILVVAAAVVVNLEEVGVANAGVIRR